MNVRLFQCSCNYHLRFGASSCSYCFKPTPIWNRYGFTIGMVAVLAVVLALVFSA
ncbi:hypothetical protein [Tropicibacter naphthalenivorans]|uniref:hypothetical protein n=1 Tax=Tropicibacter naphthalenivorans TaxID=441103 RepID=UPI00163EAA23|nr:hypothetical protein [Tropicibacter naphthalenivorans]